MNKRFLLLALLSLLSTGITAQITFETGTLAAVLEKAKKEHKPVFVDVYAVWCGPCKRMAATAFVDKEVAELYNAHFINLKLDGEKNDGPAVMREYGIDAYPTLLYFNADGKLVKKVVGGQEAKQLQQHANLLLKPESSPSYAGRKAYWSSKKSQSDLKKLIVELIALEDDSLEHYMQVYYAAYPKLSLDDKAEFEVFYRNENDVTKPISIEFMDHPEKYQADLYTDKLGMFIQQSYMRAVEAGDFSIVEKDVRNIYPYMQKTSANVPDLESYIAYIKSEFEKN